MQSSWRCRTHDGAGGDTLLRLCYVHGPYLIVYGMHAGWEKWQYGLPSSNGRQHARHCKHRSVSKMCVYSANIRQGS